MRSTIARLLRRESSYEPEVQAAISRIVGPGWTGVMLHEAVGHGLEGDFNRKKTSAFAGLMGQQVTAKGVTVVDDGTMSERRGSLTIDDEGTPTRRTVLIEDGILVGYMQDRQNARLMNMKPTGNGRRESHAHVPMPRMTNTYMLAGNHDPQEIIASVKNGIYAVSFGVWYFASIEESKIVTATLSALYIAIYLHLRDDWTMRGAVLRRPAARRSAWRSFTVGLSTLRALGFTPCRAFANISRLGYPFRIQVASVSAKSRFSSPSPSPRTSMARFTACNELTATRDR